MQNDMCFAINTHTNPVCILAPGQKNPRPKVHASGSPKPPSVLSFRQQDPNVPCSNSPSSLTSGLCRICPWILAQALTENPETDFQHQVHASTHGTWPGEDFSRIWKLKIQTWPLRLS